MGQPSLEAAVADYNTYRASMGYPPISNPQPCPETHGYKGTSTLYYYDEAGHIIGIYSSSGALTEEIVWLGDTPIASLRPKSGGGIDIYSIHTDHLNMPRLITDSVNTAARWQWDAEPFGGGTVNNDPSGAGAFNFDLRFPGQIVIAESAYTTTTLEITTRAPGGMCSQIRLE